ncbi:MAG: AAA family ATPase [Duncaniella sp.]|nr:AAA family ATPase [Duncaniella sp.]
MFKRKDLALDEFIGCCGTCYEEEMDDEAFAPNNEEETATAEEKDKEEEDFMGSAAAKTPIDELNGMVGLEEVKTKVQSVANVMKFFRMRKVKRLKVKPISLHSLFLGAPGTGKTTVARQMGRIMKECGVLSSGHVVEKDRSHLVGQYYSSTHENTLKAIEEARGGVLFIDEAYQLHAPEDPKDPGHDVLDTLMGVLSDESERDLMVILAGYTEKTLEMLELNPGMKSRFPECNHYRFADYSPEELLRIAEDYFLREEYLLTPEARYRLATRLEHDHRRAGQDFANGRHVITLIENRIIPSMAARATMSIGRGTIDEELLMTILPEDIP